MKSFAEMLWPMGWFKRQEIYKGKFLPISENILIFCNLIPRLGQFLLIGNLASNLEK
jgi:hypothetical protein